MSDCPLCSGFGWIPDGEGPGWYERNWELMLEPHRSWQRCPECGAEQPALDRLHEDLARLILRRFDAELSAWQRHGAWLAGRDEQGQGIYRWRDLACLPPGPLAGAEGWMLISSMGVQRELTRAECAEYLDKLGAPEPP